MRLDSARPVVLLSFGGEGLKGAVLPQGELAKRFVFIATEPMQDPGAPYRYIPGGELGRLGLRYCDLVRAADIVMSKPGYSIVAECVANGAAMVYSDRGPFAEYPVLEAGIRAWLPHAYLSSQDLMAGRWDQALSEVLALRPFQFPPVQADGADVVAGRLAALLSVQKESV